MVSSDAVSLIFLLILKTVFLLLFLCGLKILFSRLGKTGQPVFKETERLFEIIYLPLGFAMIAFSLIHGICSVYSAETFGWLPLMTGLIFIAVGLVAVSISHLKTVSSKKGSVSLNSDRIEVFRSSETECPEQFSSFRHTVSQTDEYKKLNSPFKSGSPRCVLEAKAEKGKTGVCGLSDSTNK